MKFKKVSKKVAAAMLTGATMVSMLGMTAFAEGVTSGIADEPIESVSIEKTVTTDGDTYAPNTSFSFVVENGTEGTYDGNVVYEGVTGGLTFAEEAVFAPTAGSVAATYSEEGSLAVDVDVFAVPGVYHYVVSEEEGDYEGIDYDDAEYDVYVYVYYDSESETNYVGNVVTVKDETKADLAFTNDYGDENDTTHDVTITKEITGDMANMSATFTFGVSVAGGDGEYYKVIVKENASDTGTTTYIVSGAAAETYEIGNGGSIQIFGLSETDEYTVTENEANEDGYTTTINGDSTTTGTNTDTVAVDGTVVNYLNAKNAVTPTGVALTIAPYILMVGLAGVLAFFFLRRRKSEF